MDKKVVRNNDVGTSRMTIKDVAEALGISKTTVSRAISGKGRIGEATREKVLAYIKEKGYQPNPIAKSLADQKTYNIAWVVPGDLGMTDLPFFQKCMAGVTKAAENKDYDVIISMVYDDNNESLKRIVRNNKVDGAVLGRTLTMDKNAEFLKEAGIPFVCVGSTDDNSVIQVDSDHVKACSELTSTLISNDLRWLALIGGNENYIVNNARKEGFERAINEANKRGLSVMSRSFMNVNTAQDVSKIVDSLIKDDVQCIIAADDRICSYLIEKLQRDNIRIPKDIKVASFYNSELISNSKPRITCLQFDPENMGATATSILISYMEGKEVSSKTLIGYKVLINGSTK